MSGQLDIRWSTPADRDAILAFIVAMGFTPRDAITWDGLGMRAACAWRGDRLVGAVPIELRPFKVVGSLTVPAAHLTCVAVHPDERGSGVGSAMQRLLGEDPPKGAWLYTVFREEPESPGYQWYLKNGFAPAMHIVSWTMKIAPHEVKHAVLLHRDATSSRSIWSKVRTHGGVIDQRERSLEWWMTVHPYRGRYTFEIIPLGEHGYALIGVGALHSDSPRLDVLDLIAANPVDAQALIELCIAHARSRGIVLVRIALAEHDPYARVAASLGMTAGWNFDLLVRPIDAGLMINSGDWQYASIDFA
jgi:GNAT superfamily N-acetyltransferase